MTTTDCTSCGHPRAAHQPGGCEWCGCTVPHAALIADGIRQGAQLRDVGIALVADAPTGADWREEASAWIQQLPPGHRFTSTELVDAVGMPDSANAVGALIRGHAVRGLIWHTGDYRRSARPGRHAGTIAVWQRL